jgi:hypothetical protein
MKMMFKLLPPSMSVLGRNALSTMGFLEVRYVDPMIFPIETDWVLRPTRRLWSFSVDVPDLPCVQPELPVAFGCLAATYDEVDLLVG